MERPWVLSHDRLIAFDLGCGIQTILRLELLRRCTEDSLDTIVDREIDGPGREIAQYRWTETSI